VQTSVKVLFETPRLRIDAAAELNAKAAMMTSTCCMVSFPGSYLSVSRKQKETELDMY
jgi:hypothetical protein